MSDKKYIVPRKMWNAAHEAHCQYNGGAASDGSLTGTILQAAIRWLAENPVVPTDEQAHELWHHPKVLNGDEHYAKAMAWDWQRMMFLAPEPGVPDAVKDLLNSPCIHGFVENIHCRGCEQLNERILEAYKRGKAGK